MNLRGPVKSVAIRGYEVVEREGKIERGVLTNRADINKTFRFDSTGFVTSAECFIGGDLTGWNEYFYNADNRLERIVWHSILFNAGNISVVEWVDGNDYIIRTCNEEGTEISQERFSRRGNRCRSTTVSSGDTVTAKTHYRKHRPVEVERRMGDYTVKLEYVYDRKGNESVVRNYIDGEDAGMTQIEYNTYDEAGNWTERILYTVDVSGCRVPLMMEVRELEYYRL